MRLILTRHGETEENRTGIVQGHLPGKLSNLGKEQASKLALRLKSEKFDVIFSSDLARAANTAKEIAKFHSDVPIYFVKELREYNFGSYAGKHKNEVDWDNYPEDAETHEQVLIRAKNFLDQVYDKYTNKKVLFVAHGGINCSLISLIEGKKRDVNDWSQKNTCVNIFDLKEEGNHKIHLLNCAKHLE